MTQWDGDQLPYQQVEYREDAIGDDHRGEPPMREEQDDAQLNDDLSDGAIEVEVRAPMTDGHVLVQDIEG